MVTEKRTVRSELREFCAELREGFQNWRLRKRAQPVARIDLPPPEALMPEQDEITFTPITLEANAGQQVDGTHRGTNAAVANVCPITRQVLNPAARIYQCRQCGIYYSPEGWEFLRQTAKGQCCGCRSVNTVLPAVRET